MDGHVLVKLHQFKKQNQNQYFAVETSSFLPNSKTSPDLSFRNPSKAFISDVRYSQLVITNSGEMDDAILIMSLLLMECCWDFGVWRHCHMNYIAWLELQK